MREGEEEEEEEKEVASAHQRRLAAVERGLKGTVLGSLLLPLLAVVSGPDVCTLQMANTLQKRISTLAQLASEVSGGWGRRRIKGATTQLLQLGLKTAHDQ